MTRIGATQEVLVKIMVDREGEMCHNIIYI
jgi:hypothetical protein